jgi:hypothetical protein
MNSFTEEDIFNYLDQSMSPEKRKQFEKRLVSDPELKAALSEAITAHQFFRSNPLEKAPEHLATQIMNRVSKAAKTKYYRPSGLFSNTSFLLVSGVVTAVVAFLSLINSGYFDVQSMAPGLFTNETHLISFPENLSRIISNSLVVIYGVLALVVLDKFVFNPLFRKRVKRLGYH